MEVHAKAASDKKLKDQFVLRLLKIVKKPEANRPSNHFEVIIVTNSEKRGHIFRLVARTGRGGRTFVIHLAVAVDVGLPDHLVDLLVGQLFSEVRHDVAKFGGGDEAVAVLENGVKLRRPLDAGLSSSPCRTLGTLL
jgi:hypothetical protein